MAKRISRQQFDRRMSTARAVYLKDIEAAHGDNAKVSLADKKLHWAEEAATEAFNHRSALYRFFDSVPLIGKPVAIVLDHIEKGVAEHGLFLGLARGLPIGLVLATSLVVVVEAVTYFHGVWNKRVETRYGAAALSRERVAVIEDAAREEREQRIHRAKSPASALGSVRYYALDEMRVDVSTVDGKPPDFGALVERDPDVLRREPRSLGPGVKISAFFHYIEPRENAQIPVVGTTIPATSKQAHRDVASVTDPQTNAVYVLAAIGEDLILIPLSDYQASGLPLHEEVDDGSETEKNPTR